MKIVTVLGARPQFIKHCPTGKAIRALGMEDVIIHTGQHYDREMSEFFFVELQIPQPAFNLGIGSGTQARQMAAMMENLEKLLTEINPDLLLVHGDTNSTLAGALTAVKLGIPVAHNEAGMRSYNRAMPEEINRVLTDHCSSLLFCPTPTPAENLRREGIIEGVHLIGDVQYDVSLLHFEHAVQNSKITQGLSISTGDYILVTLHRPYTVDDPERLKKLFAIFANLKERIILPLHPRTKARLKEFAISVPRNVVIIAPVGYLDMMALEISARMIMTDSGGVQKEAYYHGVPCLTLRPETEWIETVQAGWNRVVDTDAEKIMESAGNRWWPDDRPPIFGDGKAAEKLATAMLNFLS